MELGRGALWVVLVMFGCTQADTSEIEEVAAQAQAQVADLARQVADMQQKIKKLRTDVETLRHLVKFRGKAPLAADVEEPTDEPEPEPDTESEDAVDMGLDPVDAKSAVGREALAALPPTPTAPKEEEPVPAAEPEKPAQPARKVKIGVQTTPPGATVFVNGKNEGTTPMWLTVETTGSDIPLRVEKAGFRPIIQNIRPQANTKLTLTLTKQ